jgi:hypothetical protein
MSKKLNYLPYKEKKFSFAYLILTNKQKLDVCDRSKLTKPTVCRNGLKLCVLYIWKIFYLLLRVSSPIDQLSAEE